MLLPIIDVFVSHWPNALRHHKHPTPSMIALAAKLGNTPLNTNDWDAYDRRFERYLARWAMETHSETTRKMLESDIVKDLESEQFLLAIQSLAPSEAAAQLAKALPNLGRPLSSGELTILGSQLNQPEVSKALASILANPAQQITLLRSFENIEPKLAADPNLANLVGKASLEIFPKTAFENQLLIIRLASKFRINSLEDPIRKWLDSTKRSQSNTLSAITALREIGSSDRAFFEKHYRSPDPLIKREALISLAGLKDIALVSFIAQEWDSLPGDLRQVVIHGLTSTPEKAAALAKAAASKQFNDLTADSIGSLVSVLGANHPDIKTIIKGSPRPAPTRH
jgi:hypothetical protein